MPAAVQFGFAPPRGAIFFSGRRPRIKRPHIMLPRRAHREAIQAQMDLETMMAAAVVEQAAYFRAIAGALLESARHSFRIQHDVVHWPLEALHHLTGHVRRVAEIFAAARIVGRAGIRKDAGMPLGGPPFPPILQGGAGAFAEILGGVPPQSAIQYLLSLPVATRQEWERLIAANRGPAFTAAGVEQKAALQALKELVIEGLDAGWTEDQFVRNAQELLRKFQQQAGSLRTLWNTTVGNALARGREEELNKPEVTALLPWRLFDAIIDSRTRPNHAELDNGMARWDWDGWDTYAPLLGFNCRCTLIGITRSRAEAMLDSGAGFNLEENIPPGAGPDAGFARA